MGWFWGSSSSSDADPSKDPLRDLDPSLRDFLKRESPVKYDTSNPPSTQKPSPGAALSAVESADTSTAASAPIAQDEAHARVPAQSLYKDGRYAHLWKTYESQSDVENSNKSDQEKISDVLEGYKYRKAEIGRAALENCALEQWDVNDCFRNGSWKARLTMCRDDNRKLERCYLMQAKFLKALGYLSSFDRPQEVDEQIQMHADTLYHRMLDQEQAIEAAKAEGKPIPTFPSLLTPNRTLSAQSQSTTSAPEENKLDMSHLTSSVQASLQERLAGLSDDEKRLEEQAIKAEIQAGEQVAERLGTIFEKQEEERRIRKEQGKETIADKISSTFGFR